MKNILFKVMKLTLIKMYNCKNN